MSKTTKSKGQVVNQAKTGNVGKKSTSRKQHAAKALNNVVDQTKNGIDIVAGLADVVNPLNKSKGKAIAQLGKGAVDGVVNGVKAVVNGAKALFNHPEWYEAYLPEGLINLNYGRRKGMLEPSMNVYGITPSGTSTDTRLASVPLCGRINVDLVIPKTNTDGWGQGIRYLYNELNSTQTGNPRFSISDLEAYVIGVRNFHALYADLRRAFATFSTINAYDASTPGSLLASMGWSEGAFAGHAANIRNFGVLLGRKISKLAPMNINLINRTRWMFSNLFADSDDLKHSCWVMNLASFPQPTFGADGKVTGYTQTQLATAKSTWLTYPGAVENWLNTFVNNPIMSYIASVMMKAYGADAFYPTDVWDIDMETPIIYDQAALTQIQNAVVINTTSVPAVTYTVTEGSTTKSAVQYTTTKLSDTNIDNFTDTCFVNMYKDTVSAGETLSATRFSVMFTASNTPGVNEATINFDVYGTEISRDASVIIYDGTKKDYTFMPIGMFHDVVSYGGTGMPTLVADLSGAIDWSPMSVPKMMIIQGTSPSQTIYSYNLYPIWDFNNYAVLNGTEELSTLHDYAVLSLLKPAIRMEQGTFKKA